MARNTVAAGVVMVCLLLGAAFMSTALWTDAAGPNRPLALALGGMLSGAGLLAYFLPGSEPVTNQDESERDP